MGGWVQGHFPDERSGVVAQGWNVDYLAVGLVTSLVLLVFGWGWNVWCGAGGLARCWVLRERAPGARVSSAGRFFGRTVLVVPCVGVVGVGAGEWERFPPVA